jgi:hypothetical protein
MGLYFVLRAGTPEEHYYKKRVIVREWISCSILLSHNCRANRQLWSPLSQELFGNQHGGQLLDSHIPQEDLARVRGFPELLAWSKSNVILAGIQDLI